jgi:hypothetical protein
LCFLLRSLLPFTALAFDDGLALAALLLATVPDVLLTRVFLCCTAI